MARAMNFPMAYWGPAEEEAIGRHWSARDTPNANYWYRGSYGNGLFVVAATSGVGNRVMTSPDGVVWTVRTTTYDYNWYSSAYGNGTYVVTTPDAFPAQVMTSADGVTWTPRFSAGINFWNDVTFGNGLFVAVAETGAGNRVMTSPDGITWTLRSIADRLWSRVVWNGSVFVTVAYTGAAAGQVSTSPDGITWTARTSSHADQWNALAVDDTGKLVALSGDSASANQIMISTDNGVTWTQYALTGKNFTVLAHHSRTNTFIAGEWTADAASTGTIWTSPDGVTWTQRVTGAPQSIYSIIPSEMTVVSVSSNDSGASVPAEMTIQTSHLVIGQQPVGVLWDRRVTTNKRWLGVCHDATLGLWVAVTETGAAAGQVLTSSDGVTWTTRTSAAAKAWNSVISRNGFFVAVADTIGATNSVMTSSDGITWTSRTTPFDAALAYICDSGTLFVATGRCPAAGDYAQIFTSPDGITWTQRYSDTDYNSAGAVVWCGDLSLFVAVDSGGVAGGYYSRALTSPDGITWTHRTTPNPRQNWHGLAYKSGRFVAVGQGISGSSRLMTSTDAITWTAGPYSGLFGAGMAWDTVAAIGSLFVAVGNYHAQPATDIQYYVATSPDGDTWTGRHAATDQPYYGIASKADGTMAVAVGGLSAGQISPSNYGVMGIMTSVAGF